MKDHSIFKNPVFIMLSATFACFLWGSAFPSLKFSYNALNLSGAPFYYKLQFAGYRFLLASSMIFAFIFITKINLKITFKNLKHLFILGLIQTGFQYLFFYVGLSNTTAIKGSIMVSVGTFFSIVLPHFYYHDDKMSTRKIVGLLVGFSGVVLINLSKGSLDSSFSIFGEGFLIAASLMGAISSIMAKELSKDIHPVAITGYQMILGSIVMLLISFGFAGGNVIEFNVSVIPIFIHLGFISAAGFCIWFTLLKYNKVSTISIYKFQIPIWGSILSAIFIPNERITLITVASLGLVSLGIIVVNLKKKKATVSSSFI